MGLSLPPPKRSPRDGKESELFRSHGGRGGARRTEEGEVRDLFGEGREEARSEAPQEVFIESREAPGDGLKKRSP